MRRPLASLAVALLAVLALAAPANAVTARAAVTACPAAAVDPVEGSLEQAESTVLCLVNLERTQRGLKRLRENDRLARAAASHSQDMIRRDYFSHVAPSGSTMVDRIRGTGYLSGGRRYTMGENLAWGTGTLATPLRILESWMKSPAHKRNILQPRFEELGVGVALGAPGRDGGATYTTNFGSRD